MLPFRANDIAFMNSVVFGTKANSETPRNFSGIDAPSSTTSTSFTRISAIAAYKSVQVNKTVDDVVLLHSGAS